MVKCSFMVELRTLVHIQPIALGELIFSTFFQCLLEKSRTGKKIRNRHSSKQAISNSTHLQFCKLLHFHSTLWQFFHCLSMLSTLFYVIGKPTTGIEWVSIPCWEFLLLKIKIAFVKHGLTYKTYNCLEPYLLNVYASIQCLLRVGAIFCRFRFVWIFYEH